MGLVHNKQMILLSVHKDSALSRNPVCYPLRDESHLQLLKVEVKDLLDKEVIEPVLEHSSPGLYSRFSLVP